MLFPGHFTSLDAKKQSSPACLWGHSHVWEGSTPAPDAIPMARGRVTHGAGAPTDVLPLQPRGHLPLMWGHCNREGTVPRGQAGASQVEAQISTSWCPYKATIVLCPSAPLLRVLCHAGVPVSPPCPSPPSHPVQHPGLPLPLSHTPERVSQM